MSIKARIEALEKKLKPLTSEDLKLIKSLENILSFCDYIGFKPTEYQKKFLLDNNHFIALRWARQSGKSATVSVKLLWYALKNPHWFIMIVGPSFRQSKLVLQRRLTPLLKKIPKRFIKKALKTRIEFMNGSAIECYPGNPETIRGPTCHVVYCLPGYVNVALSDGSQIPIREIKPGQEVLTYNKSNGKLEVKKVLRVFRNPISCRKIVRVIHDFGWLDCTVEHKIFTLNRGFIPAASLTSQDKILYVDITNGVRDRNETTLLREANTTSRTVYLWRTLRRFMRSKTKRQYEKCPFSYKSFLKTSRIRSIQIFDFEKLCQNPAARNRKQRLGQKINTLFHSFASSIYRNLSNLLPKWTKDYFIRMVAKNQIAVCLSNLVYGRWKLFKILPSTQHQLFLQRGKLAFTTMAEKSMGNKFQNSSRYKRQRILLETSCKRQRFVFRFNQAIHHLIHAIQNFAEIGICSLHDLWTANHTQKISSFSWKKDCLLKQRMQKNVSKAQSGMETKRAQKLYSMWKVFRTKAKQREIVLATMQMASQALSKEALQTKKEDISFPSMLTMRSNFYSFKQPPKNLQHRMPQTTPQKIWKKSFIAKIMHLLWQSFSNIAEKSKILQCKMSRARALSEKKEEENVTYNLEVEDNHNFFAENVLVSNCDEMNFIADDEEVYDAILFTINTTNGCVILSSTPWTTDHIFYRICYEDDFNDYSRYHVTWREALEPNGPLKKMIFEKLKKQFASDPWRWKREMEAEFAEDEDVWLSQSLISQCIDSELEYWDERELVANIP